MSRPLAGAQVLVIAARREVLNQIRQTLLPMGVGFDSVSTVDAAREFCRQGLPQAIVYESLMYDSAFDGMRNDIKLQCPELAWIEIVEEGDAFEISSFGGMSMARVGRNAIGTFAAFGADVRVGQGPVAGLEPLRNRTPCARWRCRWPSDRGGSCVPLRRSSGTDHRALLPVT